MAQAPKISHISAKQRAADVANLRKARAAASRLPRTAKQKAASRLNLAKARAAQKSRRAGKKYAPAKKAAAPAVVDYAPDLGVHSLPLCGPAALAAHLRSWLAVGVPVIDVLTLHGLLGAASLPDLFEAAAQVPLAGYVLGTWTRCDEELAVPGLVYGLQLPGGYHAALGHPAGIVSWGMVLPWPAAPAEAWHLEWRTA